LVKKLFNKFRTNPKFRQNVIVWGVIIFFFLNFTEFGNQIGPQSTVPLQSTCDEFNTALLTTNINGCTNIGCGVVAPNIPFLGVFECVDVALEGAGLFCTNSPQKEFIADSKFEADDLCGAGKIAVESGDSFCFKKLYKCIDDTEDLGCKSWQKPWARVTQQIFKKSKFDCSTASYMSIGAVVLVALAVL